MTPDPDAGLADRIAAALRQERQRELKASINPPPPRPVAPVPDWLFGPDHRKRGAARVSVALLFEAPGVTIVIRAEVDA